MLGDYLNQSLTWEHILTRNEYDEMATSVITTIKGRKETVNKLVRNTLGAEILSTAGLYTEAAVVCNDKIDGRIVISSEPQTNLDGSIMYYEVYLQ